MTTGERIKRARLHAGMTQQELAEKIGVKFSAIHKYENGMIVNLKRETIAALSEALDVKPSWLMCMDDEDPELKRQHEEINEIFDRMPPDLRAHALALLKGLVPQEQSPDDRGGSD